MSLFKRPNSPFWQTEFVVRGTRIARSTGTTSRREAERFERELREEIRRQAVATAGRPRPSLTVDQACGRYWLEHGSRLRGARDVERWLRYIVVHLPADLPLRDLSASHVTEFVASMRRAGIGEISINRTVQALQGVHNRAGKLWEEPIRVIGWKPHKTREKPRVRWISEHQAQAMLAHLPEPTRALVLFMLLTGIRRREAFELEWIRVHFDRQVIAIEVKGGDEREVPLSDEALEVLHALPRDGDLVFDTTNWRKRYVAAKAAAGIQDFRWHDLRHTFATWLGQSGAPIEVIRELLGHSSISVTEKYRHVVATEARAALRNFPSLSPSNGVVVPLKRR